MRRLCFAFSLAVASAVAAMPAAASAQDKAGRAAAKGGSKAAPKHVKKAKRANARDTKDRNAPLRAASADKPAEATPATPAVDNAGRAPSTASEDAAALAVDADERVRKEGAEEVKTVEFGGLDIEGQLKTPQMLYFLNRLRAEFSRPELPHRSFIPELQRGTQENGF